MSAVFRGLLALLFTRGASERDCFRIDVPPAELPAHLEDAVARTALGEALGKRLGAVDWDGYRRQLDAMERTGTQAACWCESAYPRALLEAHSPPPFVMYKGDLSRANGPAVGVVGTRKPSVGGNAFARRLGRDLAAAGVTVVSGLARGIDTAAHLGALDEPGGTVAVIGTGVDVPYPQENAGLLVDISRRGCVLSEQRMGSPALPHVFPKRNRLISALSRAVVVVEGGRRSGALITARWALEQGREVGAVPGFPGDFRSEGPIALLRDGAFPVECAADVFEAVPALGDRDAPACAGEAAPAGPVLAALGSVPADVDEIAVSAGLDVATVQQELSRLELEGKIARDAMGRYARLRDR